MGVSNSNYTTCLDTRKSVSGYLVFLNGAPVTIKSGMQKTTALSVAEAEIFAAMQCTQDMLYVMHVLNVMCLKVRKPLLLKMDNKGAIDLINNYSVGGRMKHVDVRQYFLRELCEQKTVKVIWVPSEMNCSDLFTKNLHRPMFEKHAVTFVSEKSVK